VSSCFRSEHMLCLLTHPQSHTQRCTPFRNRPSNKQKSSNPIGRYLLFNGNAFSENYGRKCGLLCECCRIEEISWQEPWIGTAGSIWGDWKEQRRELFGIPTRPAAWCWALSSTVCSLLLLGEEAWEEDEIEHLLFHSTGHACFFHVLQLENETLSFLIYSRNVHANSFGNQKSKWSQFCTYLV